MGCVWGAWGCFLSFQGCFGGVGGCIRALRVIWECFLLNSHQYTWCTYKSTDIFQKTWGSQMSQISKCPKVTVVLTYWEASGDVSELRYKSLLCFSSKRSYCMCLPAPKYWRGIPKLKSEIEKCLSLLCLKKTQFKHEVFLNILYKEIHRNTVKGRWTKECNM